MPCWYYDKKDLRNSPSLRDGIDSAVEARYRREGARFIIDCGTKLGLRYETCATGVVFFHRFYMFHSFKEFHRYVTAVSCLFLAGKTEETPKKCKDILKITRSMLTEAQFLVFGDDPKEEVITMERILLQTIKFDLMVEHPYAYLLKFAKQIKGKMEKDKAKVQKMVQMAWTFVNDSLCTVLCLLWEPEVIAVSLMYLASRLSKTDITDWQGKPPGFKGKWYEDMVEDVNLELLEDVCHQVLDLYSAGKKKEDTPPPPPPKTPHPSTLPASATKRSRSPTPGDVQRAAPPNKVSREEKRPVSPQKGGSKQALPRTPSAPPSSGKTARQSSHAGVSNTPGSAQTITSISTSYSSSNPYMSAQMFSSSFMTQEGSQSIQSLIGGRTNYTVPPPTTPAAASTTTPYKASQPPAYPPQTNYPPPSFPQTYPASQSQQATSYTQPPYGNTQQYNYSQSQNQYSNQYQQQPSSSYTQSQYSNQQYSGTTQQYSNTSQPYNSTQPYANTGQAYTSTTQPYTASSQQSYSNTSQQYGNQYQYNTQQQGYQNYTANQNYSAPPPSGPPPPSHIQQKNPGSGGMPPVRITGRQ